MFLQFGESLTTVFSPIQQTFNGLGTTIRLLPGNSDTGISSILGGTSGNDLPFNYVRLVIGTADPLVGNLSNTDFSPFFSGASYVTDFSSSVIFTEIVRRSMSVIVSFVFPASWQSVDGQYTGDTVLRAMTAYIISGLQFLIPHVNVAYVELFSEPDNEQSLLGWISPTDHVLLSMYTQAAFGLNNIQVGIVAPCRSSVMASGHFHDSYVEKLQSAKSTVSAWGVHVQEDPMDATDETSIANKGDMTSRSLVWRCLRKTVANMDAVVMELPKIATKFASNAQYLPPCRLSDGSSGSLNTISAPDSNEYAVRVCENLMGLISAGISVACYAGLTPWAGIEERSLVNSDGTLRPVGKLFKILFSVLAPFPCQIYCPMEVNPVEDQTIKLLLATAGEFCFILSRPGNADALAGKLRLVMQNEAFTVQSMITGTSVKSFPDAMTTSTPGIDLSQIVIDWYFTTGTLTMDVSGIPYGGCIVFITGEVAV